MLGLFGSMAIAPLNMATFGPTPASTIFGVTVAAPATVAVKAATLTLASPPPEKVIVSVIVGPTPVVTEERAPWSLLMVLRGFVKPTLTAGMLSIVGKMPPGKVCVKFGLP